MSMFSAFFKLFIPSAEPDDKDQDAIRHHRRAIVAWRHWMGWSQILIWGFVWWAIGFGGAIGIEWAGAGFARAETVDRIEVQLLGEAIVQDRIRHCNAQSADGKKYFWVQLQEKLAKYEKLTSQRYELPSCEDLKGVR